MKLKKIIWSGDENCRYDHVRGASPLGEFLITWKSWKEEPSFDVEGPVGIDLYDVYSLNEAKECAHELYKAKILSCIL